MRTLDGTLGVVTRDAITRDAMSCAATTTFQVLTADRPFRIDSVELVSDAGITQDTTDYYVLVATVTTVSTPRTVGTYSLLTGADGTLAAATLTPMVLAAESGQNRVMAKGDTLALVATKHGSAANLVNLRMVVHGKYVG